MRKVLVVGCGGSGGATISHIMDQLRAQLADAGIDRLPDGWQFVHVDVPVGSRSEVEGLNSVEQAGGDYIGTGTVGDVGYATVDDSLTRKLSDAGQIEALLGWAPKDPTKVKVVTSEGAGQFRAIGRVLTINRISDVRAGLTRAFDRLGTNSADAHMHEAAARVPGIGDFVEGESPLVIVVSSMAGGAGASMALDVCRILTLIRGVDPRQVAVFMVSPDIFDTLPPIDRTGVRGNALAMFGEIVAEQTGAARAHDTAMLGALGHENGVGVEIPFQRVIPVGRTLGSESPRSVLGDGKTETVYRALGRGIAALIGSGPALTQFIRWDLTNTGGLSADQGIFGWGANWDVIPWGGFGFATVNMGRDRYREYSAQRIARAALDRLETGHLSDAEQAPEKQIAVKLDAQWPGILERLALPAAGSDVEAWFTGTAYSSAVALDTARSIVDRHLSGVPDPSGVAAGQWLSALRPRVVDARAAVLSDLGRAAQKWAYGWQRELSSRLVGEVEVAVATYGLAYAIALVTRLGEHLEATLRPALGRLAQRGIPEVTALPPVIDQQVAAIRGTVANGTALLQSLFSEYRAVYRNVVWAQGSALAEHLIAGAASELLDPLEKALREGLIEVERERRSTLSHDGLAYVATDLYTAWPSDADQRVPARFEVAENEVLLTPAAAFPSQYEGDLTGSVAPEPGEEPRFSDARRRVIGQVLEGRWVTTGGTEPPGGLVEIVAPWRSTVFTVNPETGDVQVPGRAQFNFSVGAREVLARARLFVERPDQSFDRFCRVSLADHLRAEGETDVVRSDRLRDFRDSFREALKLARPLSGVDRVIVERVHGVSMQYLYKFSEVPFGKVGSALDEMKALLDSPDIDPSSVENGTSRPSESDSVTRIDIFGSYPPYSPMAFDSVFAPIATEWQALSPAGREEFWRWRRARPLGAGLPMSDHERRAMVGGWFIGQVTGELRIPEDGGSTAVGVWDGSGWRTFPDAMLSTPDRYRYDWLPATLESYLLALARSHEPPVLESLAPYQALRRIFDSEPQRPSRASESGALPKAAASHLKHWVQTGTVPSGGVSRVTAAGETPEQRRAAAITWLTDLREFIGEKLVPTGRDGAAGGGEFSTIASRGQVSDAPMLREISDDVHIVLGRLIAHLQSPPVDAEPVF